MAIIAVYSPKGGVGKTTIAVDLAWRCAVRGGTRTLLWDLDVQGGAGFLLGCEPSAQPRAASLFQREGNARRLVASTRYTGLDQLQADPSLRQLPLQLARLGQRNRLGWLTRDLRRDYARIVLDCPPMLNELSEQIFAAADLVIVPLPPSPLGARALEQLRAEFARRDRRHPPVLPLVSMFDSRRRAHREAREGPMAGLAVIPAASPIEQMAFRRMPVGVFAPYSAAARALERVWREIETKLTELKIPPV
ncbi:ParA family protein [Novosphingobium piscinae]|uniref:ParA family protein n=1 Tax=Novosphingobium piscinae TaxID=1507448 RepID=A0A7X1FYG6_9SPHN|nr:ParA family protein [Novosphingobium piscinae]MBC2669319.1 ParA family protein [Novosphingobium piscinae]